MVVSLLTNHKVLDIRGKPIPDCTNNNEDSSDNDTPLAAPVSTDPSCREAKDDAREEDTRCDEAETSSVGTIKVVVPLWKGLEAGKERLII